MQYVSRQRPTPMRYESSWSLEEVQAWAKERQAWAKESSGASMRQTPLVRRDDDDDAVEIPIGRCRAQSLSSRHGSGNPRPDAEASASNNGLQASSHEEAARLRAEANALCRLPLTSKDRRTHSEIRQLRAVAECLESDALDCLVSVNRLREKDGMRQCPPGSSPSAEDKRRSQSCSAPPQDSRPRWNLTGRTSTAIPQDRFSSRPNSDFLRPKPTPLENRKRLLSEESRAKTMRVLAGFSRTH